MSTPCILASLSCKVVLSKQDVSLWPIVSYGEGHINIPEPTFNKPWIPLNELAITFTEAPWCLQEHTQWLFITECPQALANVWCFMEHDCYWDVM